MLRRPLICLIAVVTISLSLATSSSTQTSKLAKTPTGFYFPINSTITNDRNYLACGSAYITNLRHNGADLIFDVGTPVYAVSAGKILYKSGPAESSGWGVGNYALAIKHSSKTGDFVAVYGHIRTSLNAGDSVAAGQQIGTIGRYQETVNGKLVDKTAHLHFGIYPSGTGFPLSGWGRVTDVGCKNPSNTNGFVPPITFIRTKTPK